MSPQETRPGPFVLDAFGCRGPLRPLPGGEGRALRAGDCALKPVDDPARYEWACERLAAIRPGVYRIAQPLRSAGGGYVCRGWGATRYEPGEPAAGRWDEKLAVSHAFHTDLNRGAWRAMPPAGDRWTRAHAIAWGEAPLPQGVRPEITRRLSELFDRCTPLARTRTIIHADMCGNILFHAGLPPCVIDFSPAYGPAAYAAAILAADAVAWEGAPLDLVDRLPFDKSARQFLLRAVNFRLITSALFAPEDPGYFLSEYADFAPLIRHIS